MTAIFSISVITVAISLQLAQNRTQYQRHSVSQWKSRTTERELHAWQKNVIYWFTSLTLLLPSSMNIVNLKLSFAYPGVCVRIMMCLFVKALGYSECVSVLYYGPDSLQLWPKCKSKWHSLRIYWEYGIHHHKSTKKLWIHQK